MTLLETIGAVAVAAVIGVAVGIPLGVHHEAGKWQAAVTAEHKLELEAKANAATLESDLAKVSASADATADQLEQTREALLAKVPPIAACADSGNDVEQLRRLIEPR